MVTRSTSRSEHPRRARRRRRQLGHGSPDHQRPGWAGRTLAV